MRFSRSVTNSLRRCGQACGSPKGQFVPKRKSSFCQSRAWFSNCGAKAAERFLTVRPTLTVAGWPNAEFRRDKIGRVAEAAALTAAALPPQLELLPAEGSKRDDGRLFGNHLSGEGRMEARSSPAQ